MIIIRDRVGETGRSMGDCCVATANYIAIVRLCTKYEKFAFPIIARALIGKPCVLIREYVQCTYKRKICPEYSRVEVSKFQSCTVYTR